MELENKVILHQGNALERIPAAQLVLREGGKLADQKRFFLASDVIVGKYGVAGFLIGDNRPEDRYISYTESDKSGITYDTSSFLQLAAWEQAGESYRLNHFIDTSKGFKLVRYFVLPKEVRNFFEKDKFLGQPMIDKIACDGVIPEDFDEERAYSGQVFYDDKKDFIADIISGVSKNVNRVGDNAMTWQNVRHSLYISFHPWQLHQPVMQVANDSIHSAIASFDNFISRFDEKQVLTQRLLAQPTA